MRLSDLKKRQQVKAPTPVEPPAVAPQQQEPPSEQQPAERPKLARPATPPPPPPPPRQPPKAPKPVAPPKPPAGPQSVDLARARSDYGRAIAAVSKSLAEEPAASGVFPQLMQAAEGIVDSLKTGDPALLVLTGIATPDSPPLAHSVNVAILAVQLGANLGWSADELVRLALAGLLHDIGGRRTYRLGLEALGSAEASSIRSGLRETARLLERFPDASIDIKHVVAAIISQTHAAGSEPPPDASFDKPQLGAQILTLCDLYEAMARGLDGKAPKPAQDVFKHLLSIKERFSHILVKRLIEQLSPFPPGSLIQLADGRVGCVVKVNSRMLTRPLVELWLESDGKPRETPGMLDLAAEPLVAVSGHADERKVAAGGGAEKLDALRVWREV